MPAVQLSLPSCRVASTEMGRDWNRLDCMEYSQLYKHAMVWGANASAGNASLIWLSQVRYIILVNCLPVPQHPFSSLPGNGTSRPPHTQQKQSSLSRCSLNACMVPVFLWRLWLPSGKLGTAQDRRPRRWSARVTDGKWGKEITCDPGWCKKLMSSARRSA